MFTKNNLGQVLAILEDIRFEYFDCAWRLLDGLTIGSARDELSRSSVKMCAVMGGGDFGVNDEHVQEQFSLVGRQIEVANELSAKIVRIFASLIPAQYATDATVERVIQNLGKLTRVAEDAGVVLALENEFGITSNGEQIAHIVDSVNSPNLGVNLDPANFVVSKENPARAIEILGRRIAHMHLKDCTFTGAGRWWGYEWVELGTGQMDYRPILSALKKIGYGGFLSLEYEQSDVVRGTIMSRMYLRKLLSEI
jgi:sugar phosphate isomerase/epimerase